MNRDRFYVENPALTVVLAVQPDVVRELTRKPGFRGRGLIGRFLYAIPEPLLGRRRVDAKPVSAETVEDWNTGIRFVLNLWKAEAGDERVPHRLQPDDGARAALHEFEALLEPQLSPLR